MGAAIPSVEAAGAGMNQEWGEENFLPPDTRPDSGYGSRRALDHLLAAVSVICPWRFTLTSLLKLLADVY